MQDYVAKITIQLEKTIRGFVEIGRLLAEAQKTLGRKEWLAMVENDLPFTRRTAEKLMKIADDSRLTDERYIAKLPPHWTSLHELTLLNDEQLHRGFSEGIIHPDVERKQITALKEAGDSTSRTARKAAADRRAATMSDDTDTVEQGADPLPADGGPADPGSRSGFVAMLTATTPVAANMIGFLINQISELCHRHSVQVEFSAEYRRMAVRYEAENYMKSIREEAERGARDNDVDALNEAFFQLATGTHLAKNPNGSFNPRDIRSESFPYGDVISDVDDPTNFDALESYCLSQGILTKYTPLEALDHSAMECHLALVCLDGKAKERECALASLSEIAKTSTRAARFLQAINAQ